MRVLFVTGEFPPAQGGVGDFTNEIARALAALGVEPFVLTSAVEGSPARATENGVSVRREVKGWGWSSIRRLRAAVRETGADVAHIQYQTAAFGMHPAINLSPRLIRSVPLVVTFHDLRLPYLLPKAGRARDWITFDLARCAAAAVATNEEDYAGLRERVNGRTRLIPIGSNIAPSLPDGFERSAWRAEHGVATGDLLLSYFGFLNESKGAETLVRALPQLPDARLLMVGATVGASDATNATYLARVEALIDELGLTSRVIWTGYLPSPQVSAALMSSDLCVLPYRDGASFRRGTLMAALAHGLPIVTSTPRRAAPSSPDSPALRDGENVLLVPSDDPQALADAIWRLSADPALRARLRGGARELSQAFTWDKIAAQHLALYKQILKR